MRFTKLAVVLSLVLLLPSGTEVGAQTPATGGGAAGGGAPPAGAPTAPAQANGGAAAPVTGAGGQGVFGATNQGQPNQGQPSAAPANANANPGNANANPSATNATPGNTNAGPGGASGTANSPGASPFGSANGNTTNQPNGQPNSINNQANSMSANANSGGPFGNGRTFANSNQAGFSIQSGGTGLRVDRLLPGGIAATGGIRVGDQIVSVNGQPVSSEAQLLTQIQNGSRASQTLVGVQRDGKFQMVPLNSYAAASSGSTAGGNFGVGGFGEGATFANASGSLGANGGQTNGLAGSQSNASTNGQAGGQDGMLVSQVTPGSWAANAGLQANDRVTSINGQPLDSQFGFSAQLQAAMANGAAEVMVNRNGQSVPLRITSQQQASQANQPALSGNFSTDFDHWAGDFDTTMKQAQQNYQSRLSQMSQMNDRVTSLRAHVMSSTGQGFDRQHVADQWRTLQSDLDALGAGSNVEFQAQLNLLRSRMNQMNPSGGAAAAASGNGAASGTTTTSGSTSSASAGGTGATSPSTPPLNPPHSPPWNAFDGCGILATLRLLVAELKAAPVEL